jgi:signal transduction histidine kinase/CheY-like chemotaxis protein
MNDSTSETQQVSSLSAPVLFFGSAILALVAVGRSFLEGVGWSETTAYAVVAVVLWTVAFGTLRRPSTAAIGAIVVGVSIATFLSFHIHLNGGVESREAIWLLVLPLCFLLVAPEYPFAVAATGAAAVVGISLVGVVHGHALPDLGLLVAEGCMLAGLATYIARRNKRVRRAGLFAHERETLAHEREIAAARQLVESERKRQDAERMAGLGRLAAGVGHDINNPLTYVIQYAELGLEDLEESAEIDRDHLRESLEHVREGAVRIRDIVAQLRNLARSRALELKPVDPAQVLNGTLRLLDNQIRQRARLVLDLGEPVAVRAEAGRLGQVFVNLLVNAVDAIPTNEPGRNEIGVRIRSSDPKWISIELWDTGVGIPEEDLDTVFEPSFTTKTTQRGTGLGLAISRGLIQEFGGTLALESDPGAGTRFTIRLLRGATRPVRRAESRPVGGPVSSGRVLVVDDEPDVARVLCAALSRQHRVQVASDGRHALEFLAQEGTDIDLILCDMMMPGMDGAAFYRELRKRNPALARRIVFVSGGIFDVQTAEFVESLPNLQLDKPLDLAELRALVSDRIRLRAA